jgi:hypothetical protein
MIALQVLATNYWSLFPMSRRDGVISNGCYLGIEIGNRLGQKMYDLMNYRGTAIFLSDINQAGPGLCWYSAWELGRVRGSRPLKCEQYLAQTRTVARSKAQPGEAGLWIRFRDMD